VFYLGRCKQLNRKLSNFFKTGLLILGATIIIGLLIKGNITQEKFNSEKWKNWEMSEATWSLRWDMMNSLRNSYELKGMTKSEVIELLGIPGFKTNSKFGYSLGYSKNGINTGHFEIHFKNGKVFHYAVYEG